MPEMTPAEMAAYLDEPHVADLVTLKRDGAPHVAPVWYQYVGDRLLVMAEASAAKVRNIERDPRVAVSVATDAEPYRYVLLEGNAAVRGEGLDKTVREISTRYRGEEGGGRYTRALLKASRMVVIEITPERVISWKDVE